MLAVAHCAAIAQTAVAPSFEVASVKRVTADEESRMPIGLFTHPGGRIRATNYTLRMLIHDAFELEMDQILGDPSRAGTDRYVVEAKPPTSSCSSKWWPENFKTPSNPEMRLMLQSLLTDRFELKVHQESKVISIYALVVAKGGPKLKISKGTTVQPFVRLVQVEPRASFDLERQ